MADFTNAGDAPLVLPNGVKAVAPGAPCEVSDDVAKNPTVAGWIKDKTLVPAKGKSEKSGK